jgi:hypothetical protein
MHTAEFWCANFLETIHFGRLRRKEGYSENDMNETEHGDHRWMKLCLNARNGGGWKYVRL